MKFCRCGPRQLNLISSVLSVSFFTRKSSYTTLRNSLICQPGEVNSYLDNLTIRSGFFLVLRYKGWGKGMGTSNYTCVVLKIGATMTSVNRKYPPSSI